ncbi:MAG: hypothetical protein AM1032_000080 [Mycoplasmataceae bacterium]|nr:MAG: hypothetical protein AM1032_000080 [Mycoplasmataceae bacterium]
MKLNDESTKINNKPTFSLEEIIEISKICAFRVSIILFISRVIGLLIWAN